jgi:hypothetical protein
LGSGIISAVPVFVRISPVVSVQGDAKLLNRIAEAYGVEYRKHYAFGDSDLSAFTLWQDDNLWYSMCQNNHGLCSQDVVNALRAAHLADTAEGGSMLFFTACDFTPKGCSKGQEAGWITAGGTHSFNGVKAPSDFAILDPRRDEVDVFKGCNSFAGDTPVLMADGTSRPISQIKPGDSVSDVSPGVEAGTKTEAHTVIGRHVTYTDHDYVDVTLATDGGPKTVTGTAHHLYWDATAHGWTPASELKVGHHLRTTDGVVSIVALSPYTASMITYNLTVDAVHTYYVMAGAAPVLVHNSPGCGGIALGISEIDENPLALQEFADSVGAKSYHDWPSKGDDWVNEFKTYVADGTTEIHFNLDGIDDAVAAAAAGRGLDPIFDGHATAWELSHIQDNPASWSRVIFYRGGVPLEENPFEP